MDEESDWDSEPEVPPPKLQTAAARKPNGTVHHQQGDSRREKTSLPQEQPRDSRRSKDARRAAAGRGEPAEDGGAALPPPVSPRGSGHRLPRPRQRQQEGRQTETRRTETRRTETRRTETGRETAEEQPPFDFSPEAADDQRGSASRQKPRPPGRQQRPEYSVSAGRTAADSPAPGQTDEDPGPTPASVLSDPGPGPASVLSPSPRPRSARTLPLPLPVLHPENSTGLRATATSQADIPLNSLGSPCAAVPTPSPDQPTPLVPEPQTSGGPLVPLDGPQSSPEPGAAALAVAGSSYQFSQPDLRVLRSGGQNPSRLLDRYGRLSQRQLMKMWSELLWVASVPLLIVTTFFFALLRCLLDSVIRPVTLGPLQLLGDHLLKPAAVTLHDVLLLPAAALLGNTFSALLLAGRPLGQLMEALVRPLAALLASCRPVQVSCGTQQPPGAHQV